MEVLNEGLGDTKYRPCPLLKKYVAAGRLGKKSGRGFYDYSENAKNPEPTKNEKLGKIQAKIFLMVFMLIYCS